MKSFFLLILASISLISCADETLNAIAYMNSVAKLTNENEKLPKRLDENTIAEKVVYDVQNSTMTYTYTCLDITSETDNIDDVINSLKDIERKQRKRVVSKQGKDKYYQKLHVIIKSIYRDSKGQEFFSYEIKPEEYLNLNESLENSIYPELVYVGGSEKIQKINEFHISKTEVTVKQYRAYSHATGVKMPKKPEWGWNDEEPIVNVSWQEAIDYCDWLGETLGQNITLPSAQQWEYAAGGGSLGHNYKYSGGNSLPSVGWFKGNSEGKPHPVNSKKPNELGLVDMSGNVGEWCLCSSFDMSHNNNKSLIKGGA